MVSFLKVGDIIIDSTDDIGIITKVNNDSYLILFWLTLSESGGPVFQARLMRRMDEVKKIEFN